MSGRIFSEVRIRTTENGRTVVHDLLTGEEIDHITSLEIFETAAHRLVAVIKRVVFVRELDITTQADIREEDVSE